MKVRLNRWRAGLLTISLIELVRKAKGEGLAAAKKDVEALVDGHPIDVTFEDAGAAEAFLREAEAVGAVGHVLETAPEHPAPAGGGVPAKPDVASWVDRYRFELGATLSALLYLLSLWSMAPGGPSMLRPLPTLIFLPTLLLLAVAPVPVVAFAAPALTPVLFLLWTRLGRFDPMVPRRSVIAGVVLLVLTVAYFWVSVPYGLRFQGRPYVLAVAALQVVILIGLGMCLVWNRRARTPVSNLAFHAALFAWLGWLAFPTLGELP